MPAVPSAFGLLNPVLQVRQLLAPAAEQVAQLAEHVMQVVAVLASAEYCPAGQASQSAGEVVVSLALALHSEHAVFSFAAVVPGGIAQVLHIPVGAAVPALAVATLHGAMMRAGARRRIARTMAFI